MQITPPDPGKVAAALYDVLCRAAEVDRSSLAQQAKDEYREVLRQLTDQTASQEPPAER